jgi:hypothetical protein
MESKSPEPPDDKAAWQPLPPPPEYDGGSRRAGGTFGAPRRYSLATIFIVTGAFAALLGILRGVGTRPGVIGAIVALLLMVGVAQAAMFGGRQPRLASILAGIVWWLGVIASLMLGSRIVYGRQTLFDLFMTSACSFPLALAFGYAGGGVVAGVFMLLDFVEKGVARHRAARSRQAEDRLD